MGSDTLEGEESDPILEEAARLIQEKVEKMALKSGVLGFRTAGRNKYGTPRYETWNKISDGKKPYRKPLHKREEK